MSTKFSKKFEKFSNAENYFQNRRKSTLFRALSSAFGGMKNCRPSGNSVSRQKFFIFLQRCYASTSCTLPRPSLRMERALRSGRWDSFSAEKPRRLQRATGTLPRAAFRIPPSNEKAALTDGLIWRRRWDSNSGLKSNCVQICLLHDISYVFCNHLYHLVYMKCAS